MGTDKAVVMTAEVQTLVDTTIENLEAAFRGRIIDGHGLYADPGWQRSALVSAREALSRATVMLDQACGRTFPPSDTIDRIHPDQREDVAFLRSDPSDGP